MAFIDMPLKFLAVENSDFQLIENCLRHNGLADRCRSVSSLEELRASLGEAAWEATQESESRFRILIEQAPVAIGISRDGTGLYANHKFLQTFGLQRAEEYIGQSLLVYFAPQCHDEIRERIRRRSLGLPVPTEYESIGIRADGTVFPMHVAISQVELSDGIANVGFITDITERDRVREALEKSNSLLNATLESTADGILVISAQRNVASFNQKFLELWRIPAAVAAMRDDKLLIECAMDQLEDPDAFLAKVEDMYSNPQDCSWDELRFLDGRVIERYTQPQRLGGTVLGRVWSFRDITGRKRAEEALHQTNLRILHLNSVLRVFQDIGKLLNREKNVPILLAAVCESLVKTRDYMTVCVGEPNAESKQVLMIASSGASSPEFFSHAPVTWDDTPLGQGPAGIAIRERRPVVFENIATDPRFEPWRDAVVSSGCASIAAIPIIHGDRLFGVLVIKANRPNAFDAAEMDLLTGLADDLARALQGIENETSSRDAKEAHARLATLLEQSGESNAPISSHE